MHSPRLMIAGTHSGSGKTTVSSALLARLSAAGSLVQPFKVGPDYIDPTFHARITGRDSHNLDIWLTGEQGVNLIFSRYAQEASLCVIEGVMGLFDGLGGTDQASSAHVARLLACPVILVVDARGMALSAAAMVRGYRDFVPGMLSGIILNNVSGEAHYQLLKESIERECALPVCGYLQRGRVPELPSRHLGLIPESELEGMEERIASLASAAANLDVDRLLGIAGSAPALRTPQIARRSHSLTARIGVAQDTCFCFTYPDSLAALAEAGADLVMFSPLTDSALPPDLDGLYLPGGFPEVHAQRLAANLAMRTSVRDALVAGMPAYAECGGMLYLAKDLVDTEGKRHSMCGLLDAQAVMTDRLQRPFGYLTASLQRDCLFGKAGQDYRAHEFHYSHMVGNGAPCLSLRKADGRTWQGGYSKGRVFAAYSHLHFRGNPDLAAAFINACVQWREERI